VADDLVLEMRDIRKEFPGVVILQIDQDVQAIVVKSVFQTAAFAGYPNISFMVSRLGGAN